MRYTVYWSQDIAPAARKLPEALGAESTVVGPCGDRWQIASGLCWQAVRERIGALGVVAVVGGTSHEPDCAIAVNGRHGRTCDANAGLHRTSEAQHNEKG